MGMLRASGRQARDDVGLVETINPMVPWDAPPPLSPLPKGHDAIGEALKRKFVYQ